MCEIKKNMSLFLTKKKVLWGALNQKKKAVSLSFPYPSFPCKEHSPTWPVDIIFHARKFCHSTLSRLWLIGRRSFIFGFLTVLSRCVERLVRKKKLPSGIEKRWVLFGLSIGSVDLFLELFWRSYLCFEVVFRFWRSVLFIQSASLSLKSCSFFFQLPGQEKKNKLERRSQHGVDFFSPGESVKNQEAEVYFSWERHWGEFSARGGRVFCYGHERARSSKDSFFSFVRNCAHIVGGSSWNVLQLV